MYKSQNVYCIYSSQLYSHTHKKNAFPCIEQCHHHPSRDSKSSPRGGLDGRGVSAAGRVAVVGRGAVVVLSVPAGSSGRLVAHGGPVAVVVRLVGHDLLPTVRQVHRVRAPRQVVLVGFATGLLVPVLVVHVVLERVVVPALSIAHHQT